MSNIYVKVTIEKNRPTQNFNFLSLKVPLRVSFWGAPTHADKTELLIFLLELKNQRSRSRNVCVFSIIFILKGILMF